MRFGLLSIGLVSVVSVAACGGRTLPGGDARIPYDAPVLDVPYPWPPPPDFRPFFPDFRGDPDITVDGRPLPPQPACDATVIGKPCTQNGGECGQNGTCLLTSQVYGGVCGCQCTPDDPNTPLVNEDSCPNPTQTLCGAIKLSDGSTLDLCMRRCTPRLGVNGCKKPLACLPASTEHSGHIDQAVCMMPGCRNNADCPVRTTQHCDTSQPSTCPSGQTCVPLDEKTTRGACALPGNCDFLSGLCVRSGGTKNVKVGAPCAADTDCAANMVCEIELDPKQTKLGDHGASCATDRDCCGTCEAFRCKGTCRVRARNGYCAIRGCMFASSVGIWACPAGSTCNRLVFGGMCQKTCDLKSPNDCRGGTDTYGDYECYAWNNLSIQGRQVTDSPVCTPDVVPCDMFGAAQLSCTSLGVMNNPTNMTCRSLATKQPTSNLRDPTGFCLDNTTSGP